MRAAAKLRRFAVVLLATTALVACGEELTFDFENGKLSGWTATGEAFKSQPTEGDNSAARNLPSELQGKYWIGTYENCPKGGTSGGIQGDEPTGMLTSQAFKLEKPWVSFLVGGGNHPQQCYVAIQANQKEVTRFTGDNDERMRRVAVDLTQYLGQQIQIVVADLATGGWGHINFDDFKFHDKQPAEIQEVKHQALANGLSPEDAVKRMEVPKGFAVKLVASEPEIHQPVQFCFDERGRIWLLECFEYPRGKPVGQKGKDKILILEDTDGDGKADKVKTFYEGLNLATGLEIGYGGVFVGEAPNLVFIPDRNRDDVPDGPPEVLLTGWGREDTHELLNSFIWGPDGWLYGCHGVFTHANVAGIKFTCAVWRYHPTTKKFELFAEGGSNQWGVDFDDVGSAFITACVIPHLYHVVPGGLYIRQAGQNANPYAYGEINTIADHRHYIGNSPHGGNNRSEAAGGGHAHCGAMIYLGDTFPDEYRNCVLMGNIHGNRVNRDIPVRNKSGYVGKHGTDLMLANDRWFRCTAVKQGPDGSVYVSDWYDKQNCHNGDTNIWDRTNGRLYKVEYKGTKFPGAFDYTKLSTGELVALQSDRNDWKVRQARRILAERKDAAAIPLLKELAANGATQELRLRGLWALYCVGGFDETVGLQALNSEHPWVRVWGARFLGEANKVSDAVMSKFVELAKNDLAAEVRSQLASTCQRLAENDTVPLLHTLILRDEDARDQNIPLLLWVAYEQRLLKDTGRMVEFIKALPTTANLAQDYILPRIVRRLTATNDIAHLETAIALLGQTKSAAAQGTIVNGLLTGLQSRGVMKASEASLKTIADLREKTADGMHEALVRLSAQFGDATAIKRLQQLTASADTPQGRRIASIRTLGTIKQADSVPMLLQVLAAKPEEELSRETIRALAGHNVPEIGAEILKHWKDLPAGVRPDCLNLLCARKDWAHELMKAVEAKAVEPTAVTPNFVIKMQEFNDAELTGKIEKYIGKISPRQPDEVKQQIAKYRRIAREGIGNAAAGVKVFERTCMQCHVLFNKGNHVGPELTGSGRKDLDYLLQNIVDPNAIIGAPYYVWVVKLKDGRAITGIIAQQDDKSITVKGANNVVDILQRSDIVSMKDTKNSLMPEGQHESMMPQEFRDLIAFLQGDAWPAEPKK